ncbi:MAG: glycogen/starch synthase [Deltaproteobacteria bacterium]|nr:glycogen/starch synthase [Deltaproteobacteria bacterium]
MRTQRAPLLPSDLAAARARLDAAPAQPGGKAQVQDDFQKAAPKGKRGGAAAFDAAARREALAKLEGLAARYGEVQGLDVESTARGMSQRAGRSLRALYEALQADKAKGKLVDPARAEAMSEELLARLSQRDLPERVVRHVLRLATEDLHAMIAHPTKNRALRDGLVTHAKRYGVKPAALDGGAPPPNLPLKDRNRRETTALLALLHDRSLPASLRHLVIEQLGKVGDERALVRLQGLADRSTDPAVKASASKAVAQLNRAGKMTIVFASMEVRPYSGTGGLGNVMKELPRALAKMGHKVIVITPRHTTIDRDTLKPSGIDGHIDSPVASEPFGVLHDHADGVDHYFIENDKYFSAGRNGIYGDEHGGYGDEAERYDFFSAAVPQIIKKVLGDQAPDVVQLNDAHTGPAAAYLKADAHFKDTKTVMAIHNLGAAYQGRYNGATRDRMMIKDMGLGHAGGPAEFHGDVNFLKLGIVQADAAITVSRGYKDEILTDALGEGLHGVLRHLDGQDRLYGNLNGIDTTVWSPESDALLPAHFSFHDLEGKAACKAALQAEFGLPQRADVPVVGVVARLAHQKGWGDVVKAIEHAAATKKNVQFVLCGQGDAKIAAELKGLAERYPEMVAFDGNFTAAKEHGIYGGSDLFLMPSLFEPCGLPQMYALRYLTVPIVRAVGGLDESIDEFDPKAGKGNGFKFTDDVTKALDHAVAWYESGEAGQKALLRNCALSDFSWENRSAVEQTAVYREVING